MNGKEVVRMQHELHNGLVGVTFRKVDGSTRYMLCTLDSAIIEHFDGLPTGNSGSSPSEDLIKVFDLELMAWRSFKPSRVIKWSVNKDPENHRLYTDMVERQHGDL